jgi:hypothetical protein
MVHYRRFRVTKHRHSLGELQTFFAGNLDFRTGFFLGFAFSSGSESSSASLPGLWVALLRFLFLGEAFEAGGGEPSAIVKV